MASVVATALRPHRRTARWLGIVAGLACALGSTQASAQPAARPEQPIYDEKGREVRPEPVDGDEQKGPIQRPVPLNYVAPSYPAEARAAGIQGEVILRLDIDVDGKVTKVEVRQGLGHGLDEAAAEAAAQLRFSPARRANGNPFAARVLYRYVFTLAETRAAPPPGQGGAAEGPAAGQGAQRAVAVVPRDKGVLRVTLLIQPIEEPLVGAALTLTSEAGTVLTATTDARGELVFESLPPGRYRMTASAAGYSGVDEVEEVVAGKETIVVYRVEAQTKSGAIEVVVEGERPAREVTRRTLQAREIARIPGTKGDALRSVESMPGVARPPGPAGILLVRGSGPQDTQTFVDGVYVPIIYHFGGLSSVVPTELLSKIDFYPGNFSARYGRVMGGIVDAGIRSPRSDGYHGFVQLDMIDARLLAEGPVPLLDDWTFAVSGRRSYIDAWLGPTLQALGSGNAQAPRYWDYQLMLERKKGDDSRLRTVFYGSDDAIRVLIESPVGSSTPVAWGEDGLRTVFWRLQSLYDLKLGKDDEIHAALALGRDAIDIDFTQYFLSLSAYSFIGRAEWAHRLAPSARLNLGLDWQASIMEVGLRLPAPNPPGTPAGQPFLAQRVQQSWDRGLALRPAAYLEFELEPDERTRIVPGLRLDYARDSERLDVSPRLNARYRIVPEFPRTTAKAGIGVYQQPPQLQEVEGKSGTPGLKSNVAIHYGLGVEQEITEQFEVSLEGFYKQLDNLVRGVASPAGQGLVYTNNGSGYVVGGELLAKYKPDDHFFGWLAYTLSRSVRRVSPDAPEIPVSYDQTHILTALGSYNLGRGWEVGARFRLISGNLITPQVCDSTSEECDATRINALFHAATGAYSSMAFGDIRDERLPVFHQLDLRVDKTWKYPLWKISAYLDIQNVYNQGNVEGVSYNYNFTSRQYATGFPILPSIGVRGEI